MINLHLGDCVKVMQGMEAESFHSCVVDPPYGLSDHRTKDVIECLTKWLAGEEYRPNKKGFMGRSWDAWVPGPEAWREVYRVLKPGAHVLCFAGTRSMDLAMMAMRLAGFEMRDAIGYAHEDERGDPLQAPLIAWTYGSGFPKNRDVSVEMDRLAGVCRLDRRTPVTPKALEWDGWGTALKPAWEPIILARKPVVGTIAENVLHYGTGALNIGASLISTEDDLNGGAYAEVGGRKVSNSLHVGTGMNVEGKTVGTPLIQRNGRWPANVVHDGSAAVEACFPDAPGQKAPVTGKEPSAVTGNVLNPRTRVAFGREGEASADRRYADRGGTSFAPTPGVRRDQASSAARFFYCAKASAADRHEGMEHPGHQFQKGSTLRDAENLGESRKGNHHPTVKPTELMRYLVTLVTPPGGRVLDFTMGSGSTGKACEIDGFDFDGIEIDPESYRIAGCRIGAGAPLFQERA